LNRTEAVVATTDVADERAEQSEEALTYQVALRALGSWLDAEDAGPGVRVIETVGGFLVQRPTADGGMISDTLTFDAIWDLDALGKRKKRARRKGGYQDFLRAVGYELDAADAHTVLLAEVGDELMVTYLYPHYVGGFALIKQVSVIRGEDRETVVRAAIQRRKPGRLTKGLTRLLGDGG
jgi:hypothetical protein